MKQLLIATFTTVILAIVHQAAIAQEQKKQSLSTCELASNKGYWVVESNISNKKSATVHFYNNEHEKIYSEKVEGTYINVNKRKTQLRLNEALKSALLASAASNKVSFDLVNLFLTRK